MYGPQTMPAKKPLPSLQIQTGELTRSHDSLDRTSRRHFLAKAVRVGVVPLERDPRMIANDFDCPCLTSFGILHFFPRNKNLPPPPPKALDPAVVCEDSFGPSNHRANHKRY